MNGADVVVNRSMHKWTHRELFGRLLWEILRGPLFAWTPRICWSWRRCVLRMFGACIGEQVHVHPTVRIAVPWNLKIGDFAAVGDHAQLYSLGLIHIGCAATISQNAHLCAGTHDYRQPYMPLIKSTIEVGDGVWICADAFIGPGVTIGAKTIVGACAVVVKSMPADVIVVGNPARILKHRSPAGDFGTTDP